MLERLRHELRRRRNVQEVRRLDGHLRRDIGLPAEPTAAGSLDRVLMLQRGPFERYVD